MMICFLGRGLIAEDGKFSDVLVFHAFQGEDHTDVFGEVLQVSLVDQTVDLADFLLPLTSGHGDKPDSSEGIQAVDILLH